jgi:hypothetical protein
MMIFFELDKFVNSKNSNDFISSEGFKPLATDEVVENQNVIFYQK